MSNGMERAALAGTGLVTGAWSASVNGRRAGVG
jgi:hypothetical protein